MVMVLANGIAPEGVLILGLVLFVVPAVVVVLAEAAVLRAVTRRKFAWAAGVSVLGNLASGAAGVLLWLLFARLYPSLPTDLHVYFHAVVLFSLARYGAYFLASFGIEYAVARWRRGAEATPRLARGMLLANLLSYAVLCPLHYLATKPGHNLAALHGDTAWIGDAEATTAARVMYIDAGTGHLVRTDLRRERTETLVPHAMTAYQVTPDLGVCVFLRGTELYRYDRESGVLRALGRVAESERPREAPAMATVAMSPSGRRVAFDPMSGGVNEWGRHAPSGRLEVYDAANDQVTEVKGAWMVGAEMRCLMFMDEETLLVRAPMEEKVFEAKLSADLKETALVPFKGRVPWTGVHGTFGGLAAPFWPHPQEVATDVGGKSVHATVFRLLMSHFVQISRDEGWPEGGTDRLQLSDNPGLPGFGTHREFADLGAIPESALVVLEDKTYSTLYLVDADERAIGRLARGRGMVLGTRKYEPAKLFQAWVWK